LGGRKYTFMSENGKHLSKIDRFLVCDTFMNRWPNATLRAAPRNLSDHCPLILTTAALDFGPIPFKFFNSWVDLPGFEEAVVSGSMITCSQHEPDKILAEKLKNIKASLKDWKAKIKHGEKEVVVGLENIIQELELLAECRPLSVEECLKRLECKQRLEDIANLKRKDLKQKAKCRWAIEGDENSGFFHKVINFNSSRKRINGIMDNGQWINDPNDIKDRIFKFYEQKFSEPTMDRPCLSGDGFKRLDDDTAGKLILPFSKDEIKRAVWDCGGAKAPGPDGFTFKFFKIFWHLFETDFFNIMTRFHWEGKINRGCNSSFITLLPKIPDPQDLVDYRPISLIGAIGKVVSKILSNRLKVVLSLVVSDTQSAYVEGRSILDGPLMVNEVMGWIKKSKSKSLMLKVDLEKAFDTLNWNFLDNVLEHMNFPPLWRKWIHGTLASARTSILVNGAPTREFSIKRGVRQGDPLSPFLFILAMEALDVVMNKAVSTGLFKGITLPNNGPVLSHLLFADDVIFVGVWEERNMLNLSRILRCFYLASGLKVNYKKSKIFGLGIDANQVERAAQCLKCQIGTVPFKYLGMPLGANMNHIKNWKDVIDVFESKLSTWKAKSLSFGGRITLLKSVLGSLPLYYFSLFKAPLHVIESLERIRKKFLWSGSLTGHKMHWIDWSRIMAPKDLGGLGVGSLRSMNLALLGKWWWRAKQETSSLWFKTVNSIHYNSRSFNSIPIKQTMTGTWKNIISINNDLKLWSIDLFECIHGSLGKGDKLRFWCDQWIGNFTLGDHFPTISKLALSKECKISDCYVIIDGNIIWNIPWKKPHLSSEEQVQWNMCKLLLENVTLSNNSDSWRWIHNSDNWFSSKSLRWLIDKKYFTHREDLYENNNWLPIKANFLHWRIMLNRVPTRVSLSQRGVQVGDVSCPLCDRFEEVPNHLFALCS